MKNIKKIFIMTFLVVLVVAGIFIFFANYNVTIITKPSDEYAKLLDITNLSYFKENHLLVREEGAYYTEANGENLDQKYVNNTTYKLSDDNKIVRVSECYDEDNNVSYNWYRYKGKQYIQYNNYVKNIYPLYSFAKMIDQEENISNVPNLKNFVNYKPQFVAKYKNADSDASDEYIEEYKLYLTNDNFFKRELERYFGDRKEAYLKIGINKMDLVTSIGIGYDMASDYVYGPFNYTYYHDRNYDLSSFYEYADKKLSDDVINITFIDVNTNKEIDKVVIDKNDTLFIENGLDVDGVFLDKECKESYTAWLRIKVAKDDIENLITKDSILYVKER